MDPADFDGDGEFDVIDIDILEETEKKEKRKGGKSPKGNETPGCGFVLVVVGVSILLAKYIF